MRGCRLLVFRRLASGAFGDWSAVIRAGSAATGAWASGASMAPPSARNEPARSARRPGWRPQAVGRVAALAIAFVMIGPCLARSIACAAEAIRVADDAALRAALRGAQPGQTILIAPGRYRPGVYVDRLEGRPDAPITISGENPSRPPVFEGGTEAWHLSRCKHLVLRHLTIRGQSGNGINIDDGGQRTEPAGPMVLEDLHVSRIGPEGNRDGIKLSGLADFTIRRCTIEGWGGQAIDMVGCRRGVIEECIFRGLEGFSQATGPQTKGGTSEVVIRRCWMIDAGQRAVNIGGSTGMAFFRPPEAKYEAKQITVEGCTFVGSMAPIAFVGVDGAVVRYNTIVRPSRWVMRILQETTAEGFPPCRDGVFERNLIVYDGREVREAVNIGPNTAPESFRYRENLWFRTDRPEASRPKLPSDETGGLYGIDPRLPDVAEFGPAAGSVRDPSAGPGTETDPAVPAANQTTIKALVPREPRAAGFGAGAWKPVRDDAPSGTRPQAR